MLIHLKHHKLLKMMHTDEYLSESKKMFIVSGITIINDRDAF